MRLIACSSFLAHWLCRGSDGSIDPIDLISCVKMLAAVAPTTASAAVMPTRLLVGLLFGLVYRLHVLLG